MGASIDLSALSMQTRANVIISPPILMDSPSFLANESITGTAAKTHPPETAYKSHQEQKKEFIPTDRFRYP